VVLLVAGCWIAMRMNRVHDAFIFLALISAYIVLGISEEIIFFRRRLAEQRSQRAGGGGGPPSPPDTPKDEEVLAELGAFDAEDDRAQADGHGEDDERDSSGEQPKRA
jgi:hypothetical protein